MIMHQYYFITSKCYFSFIKTESEIVYNEYYKVLMKSRVTVNAVILNIIIQSPLSLFLIAFLYVIFIGKTVLNYVREHWSHVSLSIT